MWRSVHEILCRLEQVLQAFHSEWLRLADRDDFLIFARFWIHILPRLLIGKPCLPLEWWNRPITLAPHFEVTEAAIPGSTHQRSYDTNLVAPTFYGSSGFFPGLQQK